MEIISTGNALRGVGAIAWNGGNNNNYRIGHEGKVDLIAVTPASGGSYYPQHLPIIDGDKFASEF